MATLLEIARRERRPSLLELAQQPSPLEAYEATRPSTLEENQRALAEAGAVPTSEIESVVGDLHRGPGGEVQDPGLVGGLRGLLNPGGPQGGILQSGLAEYVGAPLMKLGELGLRASPAGMALKAAGVDVAGKSDEVRQAIHKEFTRRREAYLTANPTKTRTGIAGAVEFGSQLLPLLPGGLLARAASAAGRAAGLGNVAARGLGGAVAGSAEAGLAGLADAPLLPESERTGSVVGSFAAGALLGGVAGRAAARKVPAADDVVREFRQLYFHEPEEPIGTGVERLRSLGRRVYTAMVDEFGPATRTVRPAGAADTRRMEELLQRVRASASIAQTPVMLETRLYDHSTGEWRRTGESLRDILRDVGDAYDDAEAYLAARRHLVDLSRRGEGVKVDPQATARAQDLIDGLASKYGVDEAGRINVLDDVADRFTAWNDRMLLVLQNAGFLDEAAIQRIAAENGHYAFFSRAGKRSPIEEALAERGLLEELTAGERGRGLGTSGRAQPVKRIHEGLSAESKIDPIFESSAQRAMRIQRLADRQHVRNHVADLADRIPEIGAEVRPAKAKSVPIYQEGELVGFTNREPEGFAVWRDGKKTVYEASPGLLRALDGLTPKEAGLLRTVLSAPARLLRAGATLVPGFVGRNIFRDQLTAGVYSRHGYIPFYDAGKALIDNLWHRVTRGTNAPIWDEYLNSGAAASTLVALDKATIRDSLWRTRRLLGRPVTAKSAVQRLRRWRSNPLYALQDIFDAVLLPLEAVSDIAEKATRVGEFRLARQGGRRTLAGLPLPGTRRGAGATIPAAALDAADVTLNFSRAGRVGREWNRYEAFVNAEMQDVDRFARAMKQKPAETLIKAFSYITVPALAEWAKWHDDPDWQAREGWEKAIFFHVKKRDDGSFVRVPKPIGVLGLLFGTAIQEALSYMADKDPEAIPRLVDAVSEQTPAHFLFQTDQGKPEISTDLIPTAGEPLVELATGKDLFFGGDIVPKRLARLDEEEQVTDRIGPTARGLAAGARAVGLPKVGSPIMMQHALEGYGAGTARMLLDVSDAGLRATGLSDQPEPLSERLPSYLMPFVSKPPFGPGSKAVTELYDRAGEAEVAANTFRAILRQGRRADAMAYLERHPEARYGRVLTKVREQLSDMLKVRRTIAGDDKAPEDVRRERMLQIDQMLTAIAAEAIAAVERAEIVAQGAE